MILGITFKDYSTVFFLTGLISVNIFYFFLIVILSLSCYALEKRFCNLTLFCQLTSSVLGTSHLFSYYHIIVNASSVYHRWYFYFTHEDSEVWKEWSFPLYHSSGMEDQGQVPTCLSLKLMFFLFPHCLLTLLSDAELHQ